MSLSLRGMQLDIPLLAGGAAAKPALSIQIPLLAPLVWWQTDEVSGLIENQMSVEGSDLLGGAGTFDSATGWTVPTPPWSISSGAAHYDETTANHMVHAITGSVGRGDTIRVPFDMVTASEGRLYLRNAANQAAWGLADANWATGAHENLLRSLVAISSTIQVRGDTAGIQVSFDLDNLYVYNHAQYEGETSGDVVRNQDGPGNTIMLAFNDASGGDGVVTMYGVGLDGLATAEIALWVNPDTLPTNAVILSKASAWLIEIDASDKVHVVRNYSTTSAEATSSIALPAGTNTFIRVQLDADTDLLRIWFGATEVTASQVTGVGTPTSNTNDWKMGNSAALTNPFDGHIGATVLIDNKIWTDQQWSDLTQSSDFS